MRKESTFYQKVHEKSTSSLKACKKVHFFTKKQMKSTRTSPLFPKSTLKSPFFSEKAPPPKSRPGYGPEYTNSYSSTHNLLIRPISIQNHGSFQLLIPYRVHLHQGFLIMVIYISAYNRSASF